MSLRHPNGKDRFIILMAAGILNRGSMPITEVEYKNAKTLFLAQAYDATPEVISNLTDKLKGISHGQHQQSN